MTLFIRQPKMYSLLITCILYFCTNVVFSSDNVTENFLQNQTLSNFLNNSYWKIYEGKHESLSSCVSITLEQGEYELFPNGSVHVEVYDLTLNESHYIRYNDLLTLCAPFTTDSNVLKDHVIFQSYLTRIGLGISMICLLIHLIMFYIVPELRNLPGWNLASLCVSLFISYFMLFLSSSEAVQEYHDACIAIATLTHFFMLAAILWMSIMSYDVFMSLLRATGSFRSSSGHFKWKRFGIYCLCSYGIAFIFALFSLLADVLDIVPVEYRPVYGELCWFSRKKPLLIYFAGPVIGLTCLNFVFFGLSAYIIHFNKMKADSDDQKSVLKTRYLMYFRLSVIMGVTWIVGTAATIVHAHWLWYIFVLLNTLQGLFIFLAFTCSKKVKKYFREQVLGQRRASQQTLAPTFQSYCFYANSIEKDLDKIVEKSKEKTDMIVIHM